MLVAAGVRVEPNDLSCVVDALREGLDASRWIVERGVYAAAVEEAVGVVVSVRVISDDLPRGVDALRNGEVVAEGIVDRREWGAAVGVVEEAVPRATDGCFVIPDDLAYAVDAVGEVTQGITQWIVDSGVVSGRVEETVDRGTGGCIKPDDLA